jgi:hypothetical protein
MTSPFKVLTTFKLRQWVAVERGRVLHVAKAVVGRMQHHNRLQKLHDAFHVLRGELDRRLDTRGCSIIMGRPNAVLRLSTTTSATPRAGRGASPLHNVLKGAKQRLANARSLRSMYLPVPFWALALFVVPAVVLCVFVWVKLALSGRCDASSMSANEAPCFMPAFVRTVWRCD